MHTQKGRKWGERGERDKSREKGSEKERRERKKKKQEKWFFKKPGRFLLQVKEVCVYRGFAEHHTGRLLQIFPRTVFGKLVPGVGRTLYVLIIYHRH